MLKNNLMTPLKQQIMNVSFYEDEIVARETQTTTAQYAMVKGELYRTMEIGPS